MNLIAKEVDSVCLQYCSSFVWWEICCCLPAHCLCLGRQLVQGSYCDKFLSQEKQNALNVPMKVAFPSDQEPQS